LIFIIFSDAWRRRRRRRRGKMDESDVELPGPPELPEIPEVPNQNNSPQTGRKIYSALSDEELQDGQEEYDLHPKHARV